VVLRVSVSEDLEEYKVRFEAWLIAMLFPGIKGLDVGFLTFNARPPHGFVLRTGKVTK
jgi:hypothetical protein